MYFFHLQLSHSPSNNQIILNFGHFVSQQPKLREAEAKTYHEAKLTWLA